MQSVLVLGAGLMQRPAILAAKRLGYRAVVVDGNPDAVCVPLADRFVPVDLKDRDALAALADELNAGDAPLAAVFTAGTDFSANVAFVAERCGLRGHSYQSCLNASDKARMRRCFAEAGVPSPAFREVGGDFDGAGIGYPQVVKPVDNMGGRGCRLVRDADELRGAVADAVRNSRSGRAILEDVMDGPEFSIDAVVWDGTLTVTGFADRHIFYPPYFIETGHTMPSSCDERTKLELIATFALGIQSLGLTCGVAKADIKYTAASPMVGEIAARLSGGYMSGWTYPYASGCDVTEQALLVALGKTPEYLVRNRAPLSWRPHPSVAGKAQPFALYELPCAQVSAERAWVSIPGNVAAVTGLDAAERLPFVRDVLPRAAAGDAVCFPRNNVQKCGNVITLAPTRAQAEEAAHAAIRQITLRLAPHCAQTDAFLRGECEAGERGFPPPAFPAALAVYERHPCAAVETIPAGAAVSALLPSPLLPFADGETDWNHGTLRHVLGRFDELRPNRYAMNADTFWRAVLRGSIQGALYVADGVS